MNHVPKPRKPGTDTTILILFLGVAALALGLSTLTMPPKAKLQAAVKPEDAPPTYQQALHEAEAQAAREKADLVQSGAPHGPDLSPSLNPGAAMSHGSGAPMKPETAAKPKAPVEPASKVPASKAIAQIEPDAGLGRLRTEPVKVLEEVRPAYPPYARAARVQGAVEVRVLVDKQGYPVRADVLSGPTALREQALQAAESWRFSPARRNGRPVSAPYTVRFDFRLT